MRRIIGEYGILILCLVTFLLFYIYGTKVPPNLVFDVENAWLSNEHV